MDFFVDRLITGPLAGSASTPTVATDGADPGSEPPAVGDVWAGFTSFWADQWDVILWKVVSIAIIIAVALLVRWLLHFVIVRIVERIVTGVKRKQDVTDTQALQASPLAAVRLVQRTRTLGTVLSNIVNVTLFIIVVLLVVTTINPEILGSFALLSAAIGAGLGFGAQNIVKDVLNGLFMVIEDQFGVGDVVDLGFATGVVEEVRIRVTSVRDVNGTLWFVRNGEILRVGNMSQGWSRVIIDLAVPYEADVDAIEAAMLQTATELAQSGKWRSRIIEKPEIWGLESISAEALVIRIVVKTRTSAKDDVARELRMRLKHTLDDLDVRLPSLNSVVLTGVEGATRVRGARPPKTKPNPVVAAPPAAQGRRGARRRPAAAPGTAQDRPEEVSGPDAAGQDSTGRDAAGPGPDPDPTDPRGRG